MRTYGSPYTQEKNIPVHINGYEKPVEEALEDPTIKELGLEMLKVFLEEDRK